MSNHTPDAGIPLLTEVIPEAAPVPLLEDIIATPTADAAVLMPPIAQPQADLQNPILSQQDWDRLELEIREKVLRQLQDRIDFVIEQRVRDSLADVLQTAVEGMAEQIKTGLHQTLNEVISRAVTLELNKFEKTKN